MKVSGVSLASGNQVSEKRKILATALFGEATMFIDKVRQTQRESGTLLRGRTRISPETRFAIKTISADNPVIVGLREELKVDKELIDSLYERFEEMCRRQERVIEKRLRPAIFEKLTLELWINQKAVASNVKKLMSATMYHGAIAPKLIASFPQFMDSASIYTYALENYPSSSLKFLEQVQTNITEMSNEEEFKALPAHVIKYAAINKPLEPREFLRQVKGAVAGILHESEFRSMYKQRSTVLRAAVTNPKKPREALRERFQKKGGKDKKT